ncbi:hypothetical protein PAAG_06979 [Paracoccidioides lutzii Pb01]|uniref:Uncharacterized protein n=1 Tax=Paracoccidioides lutzii (strain ATCC MYA-826 / Pb01) TaxID=502779 RepID=C1H8I3_PARBA|nr:hypothetical protein PAAG_06979 [Paracoccidioides lutzii Pb01]EEH36561.1 hypothetical protein PAAG_06979 [Paracoccidioides lutzii Pb01]
MGVNTRKPMLPAPTDSSFPDTTGGSATGTDLATDLSRRTDKTSYSIPDDGSPITISTRRRSQNRDRDESKLSRTSHQSQTSLLIEYFEGGKKGGSLNSRPSVRVKVTPSVARKIRDQNDHIQISESSGGRKPSYTRRISLGTPTPTRTKEITEGAADDLSISSIGSLADDPGTVRRPPFEIEFSRDSELSARYIQPTSDISSMPPDSMLEGLSTIPQARRQRSHSVSGDEVHEHHRSSEMLKTPSRRRSRSLSRERIAHKAAEKLTAVPRDVTRTKGRHKEKNRSRSVSKEISETDRKSSHRRSGKHRDKDLASAESSILSNSARSPQFKSGDQYSFRSGTSKSSINNPRLLETVEDAIRRLILPELKELKKDQKVRANRNQFDYDTNASLGSGSIVSRDELGRRLSKHASAPDVTKPRVVVSSDSKETPEVISEGYSGRSKECRREKPLESQYVKSYTRRLSEDSYVSDETIQRKKSKGLRDAEAAAIVGTALTTAALKHHDSKSSLDKRERRKKRNKSRSRSGSINETELMFQKHGVPPMPLRSEIDSELTRESILSQQTTDTETPVCSELARRTPHEIEPPVSRTPTRTPRAMVTGSKSNGILSAKTFSPHSQSRSAEVDEDITPTKEETRFTDYAFVKPFYGPPDEYTARALSPIQSVASYRERDSDSGKETGQRDDRSGSVSRDIPEPGHRLSIDSLSSAPSTNLARSTRPADHEEKRKAFLAQKDESGVNIGYEGTPRTSKYEPWTKSQLDESDECRHSLGQDSLDDSRDDSFVDGPFTPGQQVAQGAAANVQYVHTPVMVESAVASLHDPSVVDIHSTKSGRNSAVGSPSQHRSGSPGSFNGAQRGLIEVGPGSPLKQQQNVSSPEEKSFQKRIGVTSPPQSVGDSSEDRPHMGITGLPGAGSPIPEIGHIPDSESEINTNPSIIQGPIGGIPKENRDHWPYDATPPRSKGNEIHEPHQILGDTTSPIQGTGLVSSYSNTNFNEPFYGADHGNGYPDNKAKHGQKRDVYPDHLLTPPGIKDEGYISGANPRSPSLATPEPRGKVFEEFNDGMPGLTNLDHDDPLADTHKRYLSGYSHGMPSPLYDSSTGHGIDRIQSKDIVALMDHLTVRDAQRNARDTEILVTLVRSAAEMRNSFEDMKKFIAQQDEMLMDTNEKQHDRTQKIVGGPRPQPLGTPRTPRRTATDEEEDMRSKRKNVFKRALKGLSLKSSNDLTRVEDMLVHLLLEVEALRAAQEGRAPGTGPVSSSENIREPGQDGYEPEGQAGTSSTGGDQSGFSNSPRLIGDMKAASTRRGSEHRISPVLEGDEDLDTLTPQEQNLLDQQNAVDAQLTGRHRRGGSVSLGTPPRVHLASGALSTDTTPKMSDGKSRKHKSSSSSFFPKISRWSKTTASSMGENIRNSIQTSRKDRQSSELSRSGSDLGQDGYNTGEYYDHHGDDRLRSNMSLEQRQENRPPSPLVPSQLSEHPKYRAHRDSLNLQHPQPRQGPTGRYQSQLESQAQTFVPPIAHNSEAWASTQSLGRMTPNPNAPGSDGGYSDLSTTSAKRNAPPRPPKIRDEGPLIPQRLPKVSGDGQLTYAERMASRGSHPSNYDGTNGSPIRSSPKNKTPQRKPTGPRPITSSGSGSGYPKRPQYQGSPQQVDDDNP